MLLNADSTAVCLLVFPWLALMSKKLAATISLPLAGSKDKK